MILYIYTSHMKSEISELSTNILEKWSFSIKIIGKLVKKKPAYLDTVRTKADEFRLVIANKYAALEQDRRSR